MQKRKKLLNPNPVNAILDPLRWERQTLPEFQSKYGTGQSFQWSHQGRWYALVEIDSSDVAHIPTREPVIIEITSGQVVVCKVAFALKDTWSEDKLLLQFPDKSTNWIKHSRVQRVFRIEETDSDIQSVPFCSVHGLLSKAV